MTRRIKLTEHLSGEELEQRYRQASDGVERSHYQIVWLLQGGKKAYEVAEVTGYSTRWIGKIAQRYNEGGPEALGDQRHQNRDATCPDIRRDNRTRHRHQYAFSCGIEHAKQGQARAQSPEAEAGHQD